jgi:hypothetical protein
VVNFEAYREAIVQYWKWLDPIRPVACARFLDRLKDGADDSAKEGAVGEAVAWNWLEPRCSAIHLNESDSVGGVDFKCESPAGSFFVEVTTITVATASDKTGLHHHPIGKGAKFYGTATTAVKSEILSKSRQVSGLGDPLLVFVVTLHFEVSALAFETFHLEELLVGSHRIQVPINLTTGDSGEIEDVVSFDHPLFFQSRTLTPLRRHISGVLLGGFGLREPVVRGVLHPDPLRPFSVRCLPDTCFGSIRPWPATDTTAVVWQTADGTLCDEKSRRQRELVEGERRLRRAGLGNLIDSMRREIGRPQDTSNPLSIDL